MRPVAIALASLLLPACPGLAQTMQLPHNVTAGSTFRIPTVGSGKAVLYIVGPAQTLLRHVNLGEPILIGAGELYGAGHYVVLLEAAESSSADELDVQPSTEVGSLGFLAKPSRLPVNIHNGISGAVYIFDLYHNLITSPMLTTLELTGAGGQRQARTVVTRNGLAWVSMDSDTEEGIARFTARVGSVSSTRIINQVPGDPCSITISARPKGTRLEIRTADVRDCNHNMVPDGTIVTFTETFGESQSTVDVPLKHGVASVVMPAIKGARISAASGVVAGNDIRWDGAQ